MTQIELRSETRERQLTDQLPRDAGGGHVSVADGGHRDEGPPHRRGDRREQRLLHVLNEKNTPTCLDVRNDCIMWRPRHLLGEVAERGEDEDAHEDEEQEETQLLAAVSEREGEGLGGRGRRVAVNAESPITWRRSHSMGLQYQNCPSIICSALSFCMPGGRPSAWRA